MPNKSRHTSPHTTPPTMNHLPRPRRRRRRNRCHRRVPAGYSSTVPLPPPPSGATSARSLAAALWKMHLASDFQVNSEQNQKMEINEQSGFKQNGIFLKLEACAKLPNTDMERITKWDHYYPTFPTKPSIFYKSPKAIFESPSRGTRRDEKEVYHKIDSMKKTVILERDNRLKLEKINANLLAELKEARSSVKKYFKGYEKERQAREEIEEVCDDLAKEIEHEKAEFETWKSGSLKMREEVEEERRMLQMAEVWREERVQLKLLDAKIALENKYSQLNHLQSKIEAFLRTHNADVAAVRQAETLIKASKKGSQNWVRGESSNLLGGPLQGNLKGPDSGDSSQGSVQSINGVFKEKNCSENYNESINSKNEVANGKLGSDLSEVCSSASRNSRSKGTISVNKFWSNNGNSTKSGADVQKKKRRNGLKGKIVGIRKELPNVEIGTGENDFVF